MYGSLQRKNAIGFFKNHSVFWFRGVAAFNPAHPEKLPMLQPSDRLIKTGSKRKSIIRVCLSPSLAVKPKQAISKANPLLNPQPPRGPMWLKQRRTNMFLAGGDELLRAKLASVVNEIDFERRWRLIPFN